jgi:uncharacterized protein DUF2530
MTNEPTDDGEKASPQNEVAVPSLPDALLDPPPVIAVCTLAWVVAVVLAFTVPALQTWRPVTVAGLGLAAFGTSVFLWQRRAARRGARGAQTGLR